MLKKLFNSVQDRFQNKTSDHPLGSSAGIAQTLSGIAAGDPARMLFDVDDWLAGMEGHLVEISPRQALTAILKLDDHSYRGMVELVSHYLNPRRREHLAESVWGAVDQHAGHLLDSYRLILGIAARESKPIAEPAVLACAAARALRAWSVKKKLLYFRYRQVPGLLWMTAHEIIRLCAAQQWLQVPTVAYLEEASTTPLREYLGGLYFDLAPVSNLAPLQLEFIDRFLHSFENLELTSQPHDGSTHYVDLATASGPARLTSNQSGAGVRYISVSKLNDRLLRSSVAWIKGSQQPDWLAALELTPDQLKAVLAALVGQWSAIPPHRAAERTSSSGVMLVSFGFMMARRMVAYSQFARMGRQITYDTVDFEKYYQERFGRVTAVEPVTDGGIAEEEASPQIVSPIDIVRRFETAGDREQMETWQQVDASDTGIGAIPPAILPRHKIGLLLAMRYEESFEWQLRIVRRLGRDATNRPSIGLETLPWPSLPALVKIDGDASAWSKTIEGGHGWVDAILISSGTDDLILPRDAFVAGRTLRINSDEGHWYIRMSHLIDRGPDYDYIEFERLTQVESP